MIKTFLCYSGYLNRDGILFAKNFLYNILPKNFTLKFPRIRPPTDEPGDA